MAEDLKEVQGQYIDYPYPARNPEDEKKRLLKIVGLYLGEINHYLFKGQQDFKNGFRILIAGGGTGDSTIYLAEQLKHTNAEIVYLDFSKSSMKIAQERAEVRKLKNITWIENSILNLSNLNLGKFDFIECCGVLHHLKDPDKGLKILSNHLTPNGGMAIMVYGQYGRTAVYQIQKLMTLVNKEVDSRQEEVENTWNILKGLPDSNWQIRAKDLGRDHKIFGDNGLYDLFLHKQDRAYTIPQVYDFVETANLEFVEFLNGFERCKLIIDPFIPDTKLLAKLKSRPKRERQAIAELIRGDIMKQHFWVSNTKNTIATLDDNSLVPYFFMENHAEKISKQMERLGPPPKGAQLDYSYKQSSIPITIPLHLSEYTQLFFTAMIDRTRSLNEIKNFINQVKHITDADFEKEKNSLLPMFELAGSLLLRKKTVEIPGFGDEIILNPVHKTNRITQRFLK